MKKIGVIGAMEPEVKTIIQALKETGSVKETAAGGTVFYEGHIGNVDVVIARSGVGKVNAALCAQRMIIQFGAEAIINTGIAGAMASGLGIFDFVISSDAVYHDMDAVLFGYKICEIPQMKCSAFPGDKELIEKIQKIFPTLKETEGHKLVTGRIATGDQFIAEKNLKNKIKENCNPACVEMEGAAIAHACYVNDIPFVIMRTLSDMADADVQTECKYEFNEETAANLSAAIMLETLKQL